MDPAPGGHLQPRRRHIHGVDAIQALQLALTYARREIDASGLALTWLDPHAPGDIGLPFSAPTTYGIYFQRRIEHYIESQELELGSAVTAILQERTRRRASRTEPEE